MSLSEWGTDSEGDLRCPHEHRADKRISQIIITPNSAWRSAGEFTTEEQPFAAIVADVDEDASWTLVARGNTRESCYAAAQLLNWKKP